MYIKATKVNPETQMVERVLLSNGDEVSMQEAVSYFKEGKLDNYYQLTTGPYGEFLTTVNPNMRSLLDLPQLM